MAPLTVPYNTSDDSRLDTAMHAGKLQRGVSGTAEGAAVVTVWVKSVSTAASLLPLFPTHLIPTPLSPQPSAAPACGDMQYQGASHYLWCTAPYP